jgi:hypothetical protein
MRIRLADLPPQRHLIKGERVERLMLQPEDKLPEDRVAGRISAQ